MRLRTRRWETSDSTLELKCAVRVSCYNQRIEIWAINRHVWLILVIHISVNHPVTQKSARNQIHYSIAWVF